jgi:hypothetical protein
MKKPYLFAAVLIVAAVVVMVLGFNLNPAPIAAMQRNYALYVTDDTGVFFMQLKRGVDDAAADLNVKCALEVISPGEKPPENEVLGAVIYGEGLTGFEKPQVVVGVNVVSESKSGLIATETDLDECIHAVETGEIDGFFAQDPYAMGYRALQMLVNGTRAEAVPLTYITLENLYVKENIKLVFPLLQ